jgi:uncharacterized membrane protein YczE
MIAAPVLRGGVLVRAVSLGCGLFVFALGIVLILESRLGLPPWDVLNQGISRNTPLSFGTANVAVALVVLVVAGLLGARIGPGTVANAILIGLFVDLLLRIDVAHGVAESGLPVRAVALGGGILVIGVGSGLYIGAGMGAGPRDSLMLVLARRSHVRIGVVRASLELAVTIVGFALGGRVGVGTIAFALGIGPAVELSFRTLEWLSLTAAQQPTPVPAWPAE